MKIELNVLGMSCNHCEKAIQDALRSNQAVKEVKVNLASDLVTIEFDSALASKEELITLIENQGYDVN